MFSLICFLFQEPAYCKLSYFEILKICDFVNSLKKKKHTQKKKKKKKLQKKKKKKGEEKKKKKGMGVGEEEPIKKKKKKKKKKKMLNVLRWFVESEVIVWLNYSGSRRRGLDPVTVV